MTSPRIFVELNHVVRAGMITYPGLLTPATTPHLIGDQSPSVLAELGDVRRCPVLINSGGDAQFGAPTHANDPTFLTHAGAQWLVDQGATLVGIDSINLDDVADGTRPAPPWTGAGSKAS